MASYNFVDLVFDDQQNEPNEIVIPVTYSEPVCASIEIAATGWQWPTLSPIAEA